MCHLNLMDIPMIIYSVDKQINVVKMGFEFDRNWISKTKLHDIQISRILVLYRFYGSFEIIFNLR